MISIVTPSFNQSRWLELAVASVADQNGITVEHIVQDSLSTDGTQAWLSKDKRVQAFFEKDEGMYDAIDRGLRRANGEICGYLNCDEQYLPDTLHRISSFFSKHPDIDIVFGDALVIDQAGNALSYRRAIRPSLDHIQLSHLNTFSCATFFRRRVLSKGHWLSSGWRSIGDAVWVHGMLRAGLRVATYPQLLSVFTLTGTNLSTDNLISGQEKARWLATLGAPRSKYRAWHVMLHRLRKLFAGAYHKRTFSYQIYTLSSHLQRVRMNARSVPGTWKTLR